MRVALVTFGGYGHYPLFLIKGLLGSSANVTVFAPQEIKADLERILEYGNDKVVYFRKPRMRYPSNLWMMRRLAEQMADIQSDVVHFTGYYPWMYFGFRRLSRTPLVLTVHDPERHSGDHTAKLVPGSNHWFYKYMARVIVMGEEMKKVVVDGGEIDHSSVDIVLHGNFNEFLRWADPTVEELEGTVLFFGRICGYKGLEYIVQAEPIIRKEVPNARFVIAGRGSDKYLRSVKKKMAHPEAFQFITEYIPDKMVARLYQQASLAVLPYVDATQSGPLLMAYAFSKPVVVTNVGSLPEYVVNEKTGYVVPARDPKALADRIVSLLKDRETRRKMGEEGFRMSSERLSWKTLAEEHLNVYRKACGT